MVFKEIPQEKKVVLKNCYLHSWNNSHFETYRVLILVHKVTFLLIVPISDQRIQLKYLENSEKINKMVHKKEHVNKYLKIFILNYVFNVILTLSILIFFLFLIHIYVRGKKCDQWDIITFFKKFYFELCLQCHSYFFYINLFFLFLIHIYVRGQKVWPMRYSYLF